MPRNSHVAEPFRSLLNGLIQRIEETPSEDAAADDCPCERESRVDPWCCAAGECVRGDR